jgi:hypothetical protein
LHQLNLVATAVGRIMPELIAEFIAKGVELRGCAETQKLSKQIKQIFWQLFSNMPITQYDIFL